MRPLGRLRLRGRVPVIAAGSNAAPARLAVKFAGRRGTIPVTRARLRDHAVVHAAQFALYCLDTDGAVFVRSSLGR